ncbi:MAG: MFS transporter [Candidatus Omnitrophica bacterium]|nr:MFS transporter [Candidatus Omnitrophota bacterium]
MVGIIAGIGEFFGYGIRLLSGYFADKTKAYWTFTFIGYGMLISVPLLALTGIWQIASILIVTERLGKALRSPAKDTILSQATQQIGTGFGFAINEVLDQIGALTGPLIFTGLFLWTGTKIKSAHDYQVGYNLLWLPLILLMLCVYIAFKKFPRENEFGNQPSHTIPIDQLNKVFWSYNIFTFATTLGFINFMLLGFYFKSAYQLPDSFIPLFYAIAMGIDAVAALIVGKLYDRFKNKKQNILAGLNTLIIIPILTALIPFFIFVNQIWTIVIGVLLWGIVMGCHETIMKSAIADLTPLKKRGTGYGIFNVNYGLSMLVGGILFGFTFQHFQPIISMVTVVLIEFVALILFFNMKQQLN